MKENIIEEYLKNQDEILKRLDKLSKKEFHYSMHLNTINKFEAIIVGILATLTTSFLIFFLQEGSIRKLLGSGVIIGTMIGFLIALLLVSFYFMCNAIKKKKSESDEIRKLYNSR